MAVEVVHCVCVCVCVCVLLAVLHWRDMGVLQVSAAVCWEAARDSTGDQTL